MSKEHTVASLPPGGAPALVPSLPPLPSAPGGHVPLAGPFYLGLMGSLPSSQLPDLSPGPASEPLTLLQRRACWAVTFVQAGGQRHFPGASSEKWCESSPFSTFLPILESQTSVCV